MTRVLRWVDDVETIVQASHLFDAPATPKWAQRFLDEPGHFLAVAYEDGEPAGFVSAVETVHPDKGAEMFLYELGVDERFRQRGIGRELVSALAGLARDRGCYGMWVLTDADNSAALATYTGAGAAERDDQVMLSWRFS